MKTNYIILYTEKIQNGGFKGTTKLPGASALGKTFEKMGGNLKIGLSVEKLDENSAIAMQKRNPNILAVAPEMPIKLIKPFKSKHKTKKASLWNIKAVGADASPYSGKGIKMCILDTGIDASHPAFLGVNIMQKDFTGEGDGDTDGHGTHCAGVAFGRDILGQQIGVARGVNDVLIGKVLGENAGGSEAIVDSILWAVDQGANIISMSFGIDFPRYAKCLEDRGMQKEAAISFALEGYRKNILLFDSLSSLVLTKAQMGMSQPISLIAAAGNESSRPDYKIAVSPPAVSKDFISVGALDRSGSDLTVASFSNTGVLLSAPGVGIMSAKANTSGLISLDGTSMATPHVAGIAALWAEKLEVKSQFTSEILKANLIASCDDEQLKKEDPEDYGVGIVKAPTN